MTIAFKEAGDSSIKKVRINNIGTTNLSPHFLSYIYEKNRLKRILGRTRDSGRYVTLKVVIRNIEQIIRESINIQENIYRKYSAGQ